MTSRENTKVLIVYLDSAFGLKSAAAAAVVVGAGSRTCWSL